MNFKITTLLCACLFFAKENFCADLPLAQIEDIGTPQQIETLTRIFENAIMRGENLITRRIKSIGFSDNRDDFIQIHFRDLPHLQAIIDHVPDVKAADEKIVFVFDQGAPDDYREAITTDRGTFLTYDEFCHIQSSSHIDVSGDINAPGISFYFASPCRISSANITSAGLNSRFQTVLESKLEDLLIMHPQMTLDGTAQLKQRLRAQLTQQEVFPTIESIISGFIVGENLSYTPFASVHLDGSLIIAASSMDMLLRLQEDFKYTYPKQKINLIQQGYDGVYYNTELQSNIGMLVRSTGSMLFYNTASALSPLYDFIFESGADMYGLGSNSGKNLTFQAGRKLKLGLSREDPNPFLLFLDPESRRTLPGFFIVNGNAPRVATRD